MDRDRQEKEKNKRRRHREESSSSDNSPRVSQPKKKAQKQPGSMSSKMNNLNISNVPLNPPVPESSTTESDGKQRLFIGEGSLSFSLAMAKKHPETAQGIHATTYEKEDDPLFGEGSEGSKNKNELEELGARVTHGVDVNDLRQFHEEEFDHTYFNYPRAPIGRTPSAKNLLEDYTAEGSDTLKEGGKLHYAIPSSETYRGTENRTPKQTRNNFYGKDPIAYAQTRNLRFHKKLGDPQKRYGGEYGYNHEMSGKNKSREDLVGNEYVFKKETNDMSYTSQTPQEYSDITTDSGTDSDFES